VSPSAPEKRNRRARSWKEMASLGNLIVAAASGGAVLWFVYATIVRPLWKASLGE
jgi:hypothetical protein